MISIAIIQSSWPSEKRTQTTVFSRLVVSLELMMRFLRNSSLIRSLAEWTARRKLLSGRRTIRVFIAARAEESQLTSGKR
ncbi:hypothetical protein FGSG_13564 [Fusarium graminearum PH-1]|uniref:hypothetical protein n=1 Tax=Gibberella zeae (strain ATCC MYA-4620 / CBS 123657 / FGSC 9075 / NRRL 31084 / PH-1) TaxID=229533 RepID=UPI00021F1682|nr:hypothetical protein FGSG_13564 [Fusarium graminearum PH-1]ESU15912.1 hypothetical protein FGSG_13564 [Fusarium graminearum PH-1]|eukprot:XP_011328404.1 hypothetical protein FGSG_13564 [Fusarium graminearum PH-1]